MQADGVYNRLKAVAMEETLAAEDILYFSQHKFESRIGRFEGRPLHVTWEITNACNLHCSHCFVPDVGRPLPDELDTQQAYHIVDNIAESGAESLLFSGGEPLLREDLLEIARHASSSLSLSLQTNGYFLEERAEQLKDVGFSQIQVSLDGASAETHDYLRGKGSYQRALKGISKCIDLRFPSMGIAATIHVRNYDELPQMVELALDLGSDVFEARAFGAAGKGRQMAHLSLSQEQRRRMYEYLAQKQSELARIWSEDPYIILVSAAAKEACVDPHNPAVGLGCAAGILGCAITASGKVIPCVGLRVEIGDLRRERLGDIWKHSPLLKAMRNRRKLTGKCGRCEYRYLCGGCRAAAYYAYGDVMAEDPLCWHQPL